MELRWSTKLINWGYTHRCKKPRGTYQSSRVDTIDYSLILHLIAQLWVRLKGDGATLLNGAFHQSETSSCPSIPPNLVLPTTPAPFILFGRLRTPHRNRDRRSVFKVLCILQTPYFGCLGGSEWCLQGTAMPPNHWGRLALGVAVGEYGSRPVLWRPAWGRVEWYTNQRLLLTDGQRPDNQFAPLVDGVKILRLLFKCSKCTYRKKRIRLMK